VAEWTKAAVLKTADPPGSVGSNPTRSAHGSVHALRARAYQAVSAAFARQDEADAAWVAADRAITAAEQAGGRTSVIAGHFRLAHAFVRLGRYDQAEHVTTVAITALRPRIKADDARVEEFRSSSTPT
jgi:hypothetical protein